MSSPIDPLDHFELFGLAPRFAIDLDALEREYQALQLKVHPDRFASASPAERRVAMQWAARANAAYDALRSPVKRAAYLCERSGAPIDAETDTFMPRDFLLQQLEWREALDEARDDPAALARLAAATKIENDAALKDLEDALDAAHDAAAAAKLVRRLMFIEKFREELGLAANALEDSLRSH